MKINFTYVSLTAYLMIALRSLNILPFQIEHSAKFLLLILESIVILFSLISLVVLSLKPRIKITQPTETASAIPLVLGKKFWWFNTSFVMEWSCIFIVLFKPIPDFNLGILLFLFIIRQALFNYLMHRVRNTLRHLNDENSNPA